MASPTRWTWVSVNSPNWWLTGRSSVLWFMGLQRVGHDWATKLNWTELNEETRNLCPFSWWQRRSGGNLGLAPYMAVMKGWLMKESNNILSLKIKKLKCLNTVENPLSDQRPGKPQKRKSNQQKTTLRWHRYWNHWMTVFKNLVQLVELENRLENHMDWQHITDGRMINKFDLKINWKVMDITSRTCGKIPKKVEREVENKE